MTETILDDSAVSEIEDRANAATREPWHQSALAGMYIVADGTDFATIASVGEYNADGSIHLLFADAEANLEFIVHAREDIPALCATVKHLRAENENLNSELRDLKCDREASDLGYISQVETQEQATKRVAAERDDLQSQLEQLRATLAQVEQERDGLRDQLAAEVGKRVNANVERMEQSQKISQSRLERTFDDRLTDTQRGSYE